MDSGLWPASVFASPEHVVVCGICPVPEKVIKGQVNMASITETMVGLSRVGDAVVAGLREKLAR